MKRKMHIMPLIVLLAFTSWSAHRYALIIGQNHGGPAVDDLRFAEDDAKRYASLLKDIGNVPVENMKVLVHPDSSAVSKAMFQLSGTISRRPDSSETLLFFYYSGHADALGLRLDSTHFSFDTMRKVLSDIPARIRVAVFDACQSGVVVASKGGTRAEPFFFTDQNGLRGEVWIASAAADERAQESATLKSSLFSFHFFTGLHGSADASGDGRITVNEAYQYAYRKTIETSALTTGIVQHPVYRFNITGEGDIVLADLSRKRGGIVVDASCRGTFLVLSRNYTEVFADFYKGDGGDKFIALPQGDYTVINARDGNQVGVYTCTVADRKNVRCTAGLFRPPLLPYLRRVSP